MKIGVALPAQVAGVTRKDVLGFAERAERRGLDSVLVLEFEERIRSEQKFPDVKALRAQVASDVATAARLLGISPARS